MDQEVGEILQPDNSPPTVGRACTEEIIEHKWLIVQLKFKAMWLTDQTNWEDFRDMKENHPPTTATYIIANNVNRLKQKGQITYMAQKSDSGHKTSNKKNSIDL